MREQPRHKRLPWLALRSRAAAWTFENVRPSRTTRSPSLAKRRASARPNPRPAPVMTMISHLVLLASNRSGGGDRVLVESLADEHHCRPMSPKESISPRIRKDCLRCAANPGDAVRAHAGQGAAAKAGRPAIAARGSISSTSRARRGGPAVSRPGGHGPVVTSERERSSPPGRPCRGPPSTRSRRRAPCQPLACTSGRRRHASDRAEEACPSRTESRIPPNVQAIPAMGSVPGAAVLLVL